MHRLLQRENSGSGDAADDIVSAVGEPERTIRTGNDSCRCRITSTVDTHKGVVLLAIVRMFCVASCSK